MSGGEEILWDSLSLKYGRGLVKVVILTACKKRASCVLRDYVRHFNKLPREQHTGELIITRFEEGHAFKSHSYLILIADTHHSGS